MMVSCQTLDVQFQLLKLIKDSLPKGEVTLGEKPKWFLFLLKKKNVNVLK